MAQPSDNPKFKLYYWNGGLGDTTLALFAYGGIEYEDGHIKPADWPALKSSFPTGQLPVLEADGHRLYQSNAIARYIAKRVGLSGSNDWENAQIDAVVDTVTDFRSKIVDLYFTADSALKAEKLEKIKNETIPFYFGVLDGLAKENNGHFALGRLTWVDVFWTTAYDPLKHFFGAELTDLANYPHVQKVIENVNNIDSIKAWFEKRPKTDF